MAGWVYRFFARIRAVFDNRRLEVDLDEELKHHLELLSEEYEKQGMSPKEARRRAHISLGGIEQLREVHREARSVLWIENLWRDIRYGFIQLSQRKAYSLIVLTILALGTGASTAVFSLVNAVLLESLAVPEPHELRVLKWSGTEHRVMNLPGRNRMVGKRMTAESFSGSLFFSMRDDMEEHADIFGFAPLDDVAARVRGAAFDAKGMIVSDNFFSGLKVAPYMGQLFAPRESTGGTSVVITYEWWDRHFNKDVGVIGQPLVLNGNAYTVTGVLRESFPGIRPNDPRGFYVPILPGAQFLGDALSSDRRWWIRLMARLKPNVSDEQFASKLNAVFANGAGDMMQEPRVLVKPGRGGVDYDRQLYKDTLWKMLGIVSLVMLVVCANLAGLSLVRGTARQHELAIRVAIGASRTQLVRLSIVENLLLALIGGAAGILVAVWIQKTIASLLFGPTDGFHYDLGIDLKFLGFSFCLAVTTALLFGLLPALRASKAEPVNDLKDRGTSSKQKLQAGRSLVIIQICFSMLLLFGVGLYVRAFISLLALDPGFDVEKLLVFEVNPQATGYEEPQLDTFYDSMQAAITELPGVKNVTLMDHPLLSDNSNVGEFSIFNRSDDGQKPLHVNRFTISETFFDTVGVPIAMGRSLLASDTNESARVVVVNKAFVKEYFPESTALGQTMRIYGHDWRIVGICDDIKNSNIKETILPTAYFSFRQRRFYKEGCCMVRTSLAPNSITSSIRKLVANIDPEVPVIRLTTQENLLANNINQERFMVTLGSFLAGLALLLASIGLYGLMAFNLARRAREIGIRKAIGARSGDVVWPILKEALFLFTVGVGIGLPALPIFARLVGDRLYGVQSYDFFTLGFVGIVLFSVVLLSAWIPVRRSLKIDPMMALRVE